MPMTQSESEISIEKLIFVRLVAKLLLLHCQLSSTLPKPMKWKLNTKFIWFLLFTVVVLSTAIRNIKLVWPFAFKTPSSWINEFFVFLFLFFPKATGPHTCTSCSVLSGLHFNFPFLPLCISFMENYLTLLLDFRNHVLSKNPLSKIQFYPSSLLTFTICVVIAIG